MSDIIYRLPYGEMCKRCIASGEIDTIQKHLNDCLDEAYEDKNSWYKADLDFVKFKEVLNRLMLYKELCEEKKKNKLKKEIKSNG